jgi:hypothetical protein
MVPTALGFGRDKRAMRLVAKVYIAVFARVNGTDSFASRYGRWGTEVVSNVNA